MMTGMLARVTNNSRLLILGNPIANRRQPVRVAEEMAMIDVISKGRLECGFVRSVPYEVAPANSNPVRMTERMGSPRPDRESLDQPRRSVHLRRRIFPPSHGECLAASLSATSPADLGYCAQHRQPAEIARRGYTLGTFLTGYEKTPAIFDAYRTAYKAAGHGDEVPPEKLGYSGLIFVGDTEEEGRAGGQHLLWYLSHNKLPMHFRNPPGYASIEANVMALQGKQIGVRKPGWTPDLDEEMAKGVVFCGTPDQVYEQLKKFHDHVGGFGNLLSMGNAGHLSHEDTQKSLRLLAKEVYPRLKELGQAKSIAAA